MAPEQVRILAAAIVQGDHVRVGTEDFPFDRAGNLAETHRLVAEVAEIARALGRPVATPEQAREIVGVRSLAR
jgi:3-keto-5-aminohexanoate cleavage enzyme